MDDDAAVVRRRTDPYTGSRVNAKGSGSNPPSSKHSAKLKGAKRKPSKPGRHRH